MTRSTAYCMTSERAKSSALAHTSHSSMVERSSGAHYPSYQAAADRTTSDSGSQAAGKIKMQKDVGRDYDTIRQPSSADLETEQACTSSGSMLAAPLPI